MTATTMLHVRVDEDTKAEATRTLDVLGLSMSDAVRLFLKRVVIEEGLPLTLKVPNEKTRAAIKEAKAITSPRFGSVEDLFDGLDQEAGSKTSEASSKE